MSDKVCSNGSVNAIMASEYTVPYLRAHYWSNMERFDFEKGRGHACLGKVPKVGMCHLTLLCFALLCFMQFKVALSDGSVIIY